MTLEWKLNKLIKECKELKKENERLRSLLIKHQIPDISTTQKQELMSKEEIINKRIDLYSSLFRGRKDVYPLRWESKNGRSGYAPACDHEWHPELCKKPSIKCGDCQNRKFSSLSNNVIYNHLAGKISIGIYPVMEDNTAIF